MLSTAGISEGPIFRKVNKSGTLGTNALAPASVAALLKKMAAAVDIPADRIAGHSLGAELW